MSTYMPTLQSYRSNCMLAEIRLPVGGPSLGPWDHVLRSQGFANGLFAHRSLRESLK